MARFFTAQPFAFNSSGAVRALRVFCAALAMAGLPCVAGYAADDDVPPVSESDLQEGEEPTFLRRGFDAMVDRVEPIGQRMSGNVFGLDLPETLAKYDTELSINPKMGDFLDEEQVVVEMELIYGFSTDLELRTGITPYFPNPFDSGGSWGPGEVLFGARWQVMRADNEGWDVLLAAEWISPLGSPPIDVNDGYTHAGPFAVIGRPVEWFGLALYPWLDVRYEFVTDTPGRDSVPPDYIVDADSVYIKPAVLYTITEDLKWLFEYEHRFILNSERFEDSDRFLTGPIWLIPQRHTRRWLPGRFEVGLGLEWQSNEFNDEKLGIEVDIRWILEKEDL